MESVRWCVFVESHADVCAVCVKDTGDICDLLLGNWGDILSPIWDLVLENLQVYHFKEHCKIKHVATVVSKIETVSNNCLLPVEHSVA